MAFQTKVDTSLMATVSDKIFNGYISLNIKDVMSTRWLANPHQGHSQFFKYPVHYQIEDSHAQYIVI